VDISTNRSRRENRRQRELAGRRADAIAGASSVFAAKGYHDAQMAEIAAEAELSLASLYSMFVGKEEIYQEVMRVAAADVRAAVSERVAHVEGSTQRLLRLIDAFFECFEEKRDLLRIVLSGTQGLPWRIRAKMGDSAREIADSITHWVIGLCREARSGGQLAGLDPEAFAVSLLGAVTNAAARAIEEHPDQPLTRAAPGIRAVFARVLGAEVEP
jgi:AcrR family transcriptional regulator